MSEIDYASVRREIIASVELIASLDSPLAKDAGFLYDAVMDIDHLALCADNEEVLGPVLRNPEEALALRRLGEAINSVTEGVGPFMDSKPHLFLEHRDWPIVLAAARAALDALR